MKFSSKPVLIGFFLVFLTLSQFTFAQTEPETFTAKNAVYIEVGGSSGRYAVNYSKIFHQKGKLKLSASAGFSMWPKKFDSKTIWLPSIPIEVSALFGKSNHHLELGMGITSYLTRSLAFNSETFENIDKVVFDAAIPVRIGYRFQKPEGGFFFRVGYTPVINFPTGGKGGWGFDPYWAGISFGKSF
ncbi:hypothetical protein [Algoriphagus boritolerans]|uniref:Outer membrane protein beta-barrel domain-containing protein n=2 Tax=Algoriphagus TaxID=246875 RepID=A0A1H5Z251_9BACT|nr:hypothetical protein [Algoriphagus boritolerans]SEG29747.1 hypothetical protein SAMN03080598_03265 [Algoriphagus boritolerans DSM 17298 = JCM 18970]